MRIVVFSDSHGDIFQAIEVVRRNEKEKVFIFLGDGVDELETLREMYPHKEFIGVRGNCDFFCHLPDEYTMDADGVKLICTHGHLYNVKSTQEKLAEAARKKGATVALYGHTHKSLVKYDDGLYLVCPGSISRPADRYPTYATIDITKKGIFCNIVEMKR